MHGVRSAGSLGPELRFGWAWFGLAWVRDSGIQGFRDSGIGGSVCWAVRLLGCRAVAAVLDDNSSPFCARSPWRLTPCLMDEKAIDVTSWGAKVVGVCECAVCLGGVLGGCAPVCMCAWLVRRSNGPPVPWRMQRWRNRREVTASCGVTKSFGFGQAGNSFELRVFNAHFMSEECRG